MLRTDNRSPLQKIRRFDLYRLADANNISYPKDSPATVLRPILEAAGIDPTRPLPDGEELMTTVMVATEGGGERAVLAAKQKLSASQRSGINSTQILNDRVSEQAEEEEASKDSEIAELKKLLLEARKTPVTKKIAPKAKKANFFEFKKYCKEQGVKVLKTDKKADLELKLKQLGK